MYNAAIKHIVESQGLRIKPSAKKPKTAPRKNNTNPHPDRKNKSAPKKNSLETLYQDEVKAMFMQWFRKNKAVAGHVMSKKDVIVYVLKKLDKKQDAVLESAMDELNAKGLIETKEDGVTLVLTQKGAEYLQL